MKKWWFGIGATRIAIIIFGAFFILVLVGLIVWQMPIDRVDYSGIQVSSPIPISKEPIKIISHLETPDPLRGIYITACTASSKKFRSKVLSNIEGTNINSIIIDIKDYSGTLAYASSTVLSSRISTSTDSSKIAELKKKQNGCKIYDLPEFIQELHDRNIYAIARITVFQDPSFAVVHPEVAVKRKDNPDTIWKDNKGLAFIDPGAPAYWEYIVSIGKEAFDIGFDELNFDYIRFPSDGDMSNVYYSWGQGRKKDEILKDFFLYLREEFDSTGVPLSADLFGLTTSATGDLGIGQRLEDALLYFDYVAPMVYPSHFAYGFNGYSKPATEPYGVIKYSMEKAIDKTLMASSSIDKLRPWYQAFDLGAVYDREKVQAQIRAGEELGIKSYMLWNAGSVYDRGSF